MDALYIYNLYPRLYKNVKAWEKALPKIAKMGFNGIYLNPIHYPGFSGSLYAPKEYYTLNPLFFSKKGSEVEELKGFIAASNEKGIKVYLDLVVNHTSIDSPLIAEHKNWYVLENGDVKRPGAWEDGKYIQWGDLAQFDLELSSDRDGLWNYLLDMCNYFLDLGFSGFRCDAAYQVPEDFWRFLTGNVKKKFPEALFMAETLGCTPVQIQLLSNAGFDYIFNSSKWWDFNGAWCLEQYEMTKNIAPSISFPEGHDTERLFAESNSYLPKFLQRVYFSALFSKGFMITTGLEYGFKKRINTVNTNPDDWENTDNDFTPVIQKILDIKKALLPLHEESPIKIIDQANWMNVFCFYKEWEGQKVMVILNKDAYNKQSIVLGNIENILGASDITDFSPEEKIKGTITNLNILLNPGEVKIFASKAIYKTATSTVK
ncbi:MAG: hypothetical protein A2015_05755 [Spirochaetes bacterium GWF1_31_7]|nr:MAG: hypothetical protein A2Y30_00165 [Spirochaetes bacterium GWE1_32_154]OHD47195.1 MAG: hypothetical protein A2Y29_10750 [Spirochaetes bacterium GWE2_31_10]OHD48928.1 MAG: hypothetical protein A2015_05755 [Spirochaetes bacterium GWF1_31_7]OHD81838.1 MAG: hypothetical protein A2355_13930 [Spirochaetes bacterium RIFOXYB1_FULL_32_8]HBD92597.1 alpha-amylase [Spirochaetia bacterium]